MSEPGQRWNWKWIVGGVATATAIGAALWYFGSEKGPSFNASTHTVEKLYKVMDDLLVEYAAYYAQWFHMMRKMRDEGEYTEKLGQQIKMRLEELTEKADEEVAKRNEISPEVLEEWMAYYQNDKKIMEIQGLLKKNYERIFNNEAPDFQFEVPPELTREKYLNLLRKIYSTMRFRVYPKVRARFDDGTISKGSAMSEEEFDDIYMGEKLDEIREKVYDLYKISKIADQPVKKTMLKAYCTYAVDHNWQQQIIAEQKIHKDLIVKMKKGEKITGMDHDPLESVEDDYALRLHPSASTNDKTLIQPS